MYRYQTKSYWEETEEEHEVKESAGENEEVKEKETRRKTNRKTKRKRKTDRPGRIHIDVIINLHLKFSFHTQHHP